jgi:hypothetical protein
VSATLTRGWRRLLVGKFGEPLRHQGERRRIQVAVELVESATQIAEALRHRLVRRISSLLAPQVATRALMFA